MYINSAAKYNHITITLPSIWLLYSLEVVCVKKCQEKAAELGPHGLRVLCADRMCVNYEAQCARYLINILHVKHCHCSEFLPLNLLIERHCIIIALFVHCICVFKLATVKENFGLCVHDHLVIYERVVFH